MVHIDHHEVTELVADFTSAPERLAHNLGEVFKNEANALQRDMRRAAEGHRYLPEFAIRVTTQKNDELDYEIGFNKVRQGNLANIIVFGSVNNAPVYDFYGPLTRRAPYFVEHIGRIAEDSVFSGPGVIL